MATSTVIDAGDGLPLTLPAMWRHLVRAYGQNTLLVCDDVRMTYAEIEARSRVLARGLLASGVMKGTHVALLYPSGPEFIVGLIAATRIGAVAVPLSTLSTADELRWLLTNSDTSILLAAPEVRGRRFDEFLKTAFPELDYAKPPPLRTNAAPWLRRICFSGALPAGRDSGWSVADLEAAAAKVDDAMLDALEARVSPSDRFVIIHTSGSTSAPKGVIHTHGALIRHLHNINQVRNLRPEDRMFSTALWFWVAGFAFSLLGTIIAGARIIVSNAIAPADILDVVERERPTTSNGYYPTIVRLTADPTYARRDLSSMVHGNLYPVMSPTVRPKDPDLRHNIYGMTEAGSALTMSSDETDQPEHRRSSNGSLLPGFEGKIVDPETGKELGRGEAGELWIRGPFMMEGYYGKPRAAVFDADGWWRTGDVCVIDADGFVYVKGRLGDMIKTSGANVSPREVEGVMRNFTGGRECLVVGLPHPQRGQVVIAVVIAENDSDVDEAALKHQLGEKLSRYKVPRRILRLAQSELPTLSSGKVDMPKLRALVQARTESSKIAI